MQHKHYKVIESYKSPYPEPIIFKKGEIVKIGNKFTDDPDWKDWIWSIGYNNNEAWTPKQFIDISGNEGIMNRDYNALELSTEPGETLTVHEIINGFGMAEKENGKRGWVPMKCLSPLGAADIHR